MTLMFAKRRLTSLLPRSKAVLQAVLQAAAAAAAVGIVGFRHWDRHKKGYSEMQLVS